MYPIVYGYDDLDRFVVEGVRVSMDEFEEILISPLVALSGPDDPDAETSTDNATLSWAGFDHARDEDHATWRLDGLVCRAS